jgi:tyrosine-protein kinase Etk/Wzc
MTEHSTENRPFIRSVFVLLRHWRFLLGVLVVGAVAAVVISLLMPDWYRSTATFLPPQREAGMLERMAGGLTTTLKSFGIAGRKGGGDGYSYISILESRRMGETMVEQFDLMNVYEVEDKSMEKTLKILNGNSEFFYEEDGRVVISVWDTDPGRAAEMSNAYFQHLNEISTTLNATEARHNREFVELQYRVVQDSLRRTEEAFAAFQRRTKIFSMEDQAKASISAAGELYATLGMQKVRLGILERSLGPDDAEVRALRIAVSELEKQAPGLGDKDLAGLVGTSVTDLPGEGLTWLRLYRDIEILSKLQGFLLPMYQQAVIDEQKQLNVLVPLDIAQPAERKDKPKRSIIVLAAVFSVFALAIVFLLLRERFLYYAAMYPAEWISLKQAMRFRGKTGGAGA